MVVCVPRISGENTAPPGPAPWKLNISRSTGTVATPHAVLQRDRPIHNVRDVVIRKGTAQQERSADDAFIGHSVQQLKFMRRERGTQLPAALEQMHVLIAVRERRRQ